MGKFRSKLSSHGKTCYHRSQWWKQPVPYHFLGDNWLTVLSNWVTSSVNSERGDVSVLAELLISTTLDIHTEGDWREREKRGEERKGRSYLCCYSCSLFFCFLFPFWYSYLLYHCCFCLIILSFLLSFRASYSGYSRQYY